MRAGGALLLVLFAIPSSLLASEEIPLDVQPTAIVGVHVIPLDRERILVDQTVVIANGRIARIGPRAEVALGDGVRVIDGQRRYLVPGLADMHAHLTGPDRFAIYLANGITTVLNMNGSPEVLDAREQVRRGELPGPRIFTTGPLVAGQEVPWRHLLVTTPEQAAAAAEEQARAGYDFVKVYEGLTPAAFRALTATAQRQGLRAIGHVPDGVDTADILAGLAELSHVGGVYWGFLHPELDASRLPEVAARLRAAGIVVCPTLHLYQTLASRVGHEEELQKREEMRWVSEGTLGWWSAGDRSPGSTNELLSYLGPTVVRALAEAGVPLLAGTDHPNPYLVPGFSIHGELRALEAAGLTRFQVLLAATRTPARFLGIDSGTIEIGKWADLLLVDGNPLEDLGHLRELRGVMVRGRWIAGSDLREQVETLAYR